MQHPISSLDYSAVQQFGQLGIRGGYRFIRPSSEISRLVATVAAQGSILNPPAPYTNCSYHLEFYGPSLSCGSATSTNTTRIPEIINPRGQENPRPFVSFVPMSGSDDNETDPALYGLRYTLQGGSTAAFGSTFDVQSKDHGRIYVIVNDASDSDVSFGLAANKTIECGLYNMSYSVDFAFSNEQPKLTILNATRLNGVGGQGGCDYTTLSQRYDAPVCSPEAVAYMALLGAFSQQLVGFLEQSHHGYITSIQTQIAKTAFMDTQELYGWSRF